MRLIDLLDRCLTLEKRAAAVYRTFEASPSGDAQLWAELAADEEAHGRSIREARRRLVPEDLGTTVDGCETALDDVERRLAEAEHLPAAAGQDRRLIARLTSSSRRSRCSGGSRSGRLGILACLIRTTRT